MYKFAATFASVLIISFLIFPFAGAVQVTDITTGVQNANDQLATINATMTAKLNAISDQLSALPTLTQEQNLLEGQLKIQQQMMDNLKSQVIIGFIVIGLCIIGIFFGVYFWFKSQGRV